MKQLVLTTIMLMSSTLVYCGLRQTIASVKFKDKEINLVRSMSYSNYRTNPDGTKFYETMLSIIVIDGKNENEVGIPDVFYSSNDLNGFGTPCMTINPSTGSICVYVLEKTVNSNNYGMTGYAYFLEPNATRFRKETIFDNANYGWYAFFGGNASGNPALWHFAYSGYYAIKSQRSANGIWTNVIVGSIKPELAASQFNQHKQILITDEDNVDQMMNVQLLSAPKTDYTYSSTRSSLLSKEVIGGAIAIGALYLGAKALMSALSSDNNNFSTSSNLNCYILEPSDPGISVCSNSRRIDGYLVKCRDRNNYVARKIFYCPIDNYCDGYPGFNPAKGWNDEYSPIFHECTEYELKAVEATKDWYKFPEGSRLDSKMKEWCNCD